MRVLIFEDELPAAQRLRNLLAEAAPDLEIVDVLDSGKDAVAYLQKNPPPDLIISDIELADGLCFDIFSSLHIQVPVIFATAYNQYAIRAFEANAVDYLLKPVKRESLERSLEKFRMRMGLEKPAVNYSEISDTITQKLSAPPKKYLVRYGQKMRLLHPNEVAWVLPTYEIQFCRVAFRQNVSRGRKPDPNRKRPGCKPLFPNQPESDCGPWLHSRNEA